MKNGYFDECRFFRMANSRNGKFVAQFGMHGDVKINGVWSAATLMDEAVKKSNTYGMITYAKTGRPNRLSDGQCDDGDTEEMLGRIVPFVCGGIRALA